MQTIQSDNLVRKQIMLSNSNIEKLEKIAMKRSSSVAEVVRTAIDAYDPETSDMDTAELLALVSIRLKETIEDTLKTRKRLNKALEKIEKKAA